MTEKTFANYAEFAHSLYESGVLSDSWFDGNERFRLEGVVLNAELAARLSEAAERITYLHHELVQILLARPELLAEFFHLTPYQQAMWECSGGLWHGMARADLFVCEDGQIACCELNSDTPSGQPEAVLLGEMLFAQNALAHVNITNPNRNFSRQFVQMLRESHEKQTDSPLESVGIIYPTELTEDLSLITLLTRWLEDAGIKVIAGSPFNIRRTARGVEILGERVDLIYRHYKTDWWGERFPVWHDAPDFFDAEPLHQPLAALLSAEAAGEVTIVNPFGSVITQNKFSLAFFWEHQELFSAEARNWIRELVPETLRMTQLDLQRLRGEREAWVLKSDYGCEGAETICGAFVTEEVWEKALMQARAEHFVAQKFFQVRADEQGYLPNYGVYVSGGAATGFFTRLSKQSTSNAALTVPTYVAAQ